MPQVLTTNPASLPTDLRATAAVAAAPAPGVSPATRYLAAAAYTDRVFRDHVIAADEAQYRAVAPEHGIDVNFILQHCRNARRNIFVRNAALCVVLVALLWTGIVTDLIDNTGEIPDVLAYHGGALALAWIAAAAIVFAELLFTQYFTLTRGFGAGKAGGAPVAAAAPAASRTNVVVYGGFSPFVGAGLDLNGFSFAVNLEQAKSVLGERAPITAFTVGALYEAIAGSIQRLHIEGLRTADRIYVDGRAIRNDRRFLPDILGQPVALVDPATLMLLRAHPENAARHYFCVEIVNWGGEVVTSMFIRLQLTSTKLFVEASNFLLPPLKKSYYELDKRAPGHFLRDARVWLIQALVAAPFYAIGALFATWAGVMAPVQKFFADRRQRREVAKDPTHNYGAHASIREAGMENNWRAYFQRLDKEMNSKIIQQQLLDAIVEFLDRHGIDTSELKDRGAHVLNNGVIVSGGSVTAENLAVGKGSWASKAQHA